MVSRTEAPRRYLQGPPQCPTHHRHSANRCPAWMGPAPTRRQRQPSVACCSPWPGNGSACAGTTCQPSILPDARAVILPVGRPEHLGTMAWRASHHYSTALPHTSSVNSSRLPFPLKLTVFQVSWERGLATRTIRGRLAPAPRNATAQCPPGTTPNSILISCLPMCRKCEILTGRLTLPRTDPPPPQTMSPAY